MHHHDQQPGGSASVDVVVLTSAYHARRVRGVAALLLGFYGLSFHVAEVELYLGGWLKTGGKLTGFAQNMENITVLYLYLYIYYTC